MKQLDNNKKLILFDGVCNLCNQSVQYVIKHDKKDMFRFAALQSEIGQSIIKNENIDTSIIDSILLYTNNNGIKIKSTAALLIAKDLGFPNNLMSVFLIIPTFMRNWVYNYIAKNRYTWYGKREACMIPTPELRAKFMD
jgi:predicted DCC family thiol-disulfide oxidoreductase YuxK